jgi:dihydrofolate reductase
MVFFSLILACTLDGGIGYNNKIPWNIPQELGLFKKITTDINCYVKKNAIIMGRKTWESLPFKPLKDRINIVITSDSDKINFRNELIVVCKNLDEALEYCENSILIDKIFIIGGKSIYDLCLNDNRYKNKINNIHLSIIKNKYNCDTFINLKQILNEFKKYKLKDISFNSDFMYLKLHK